MNEAEWLACTDPAKMLEFLRGKASDRKLRLFACACVRLIGDRVPFDCLAAVALAEDFADALVRDLTWEMWKLTSCASSDAAHAAKQYTGQWCSAEGIPSVRLADFFRCLCGPTPFRPVSISPASLSWSDSTVVRLAQAAYEHRALPAGTLEPDRLAVLADALEEAGCEDATILGHLRSRGPHVRGCFPVDAILGRK